MMRLVHIFLLLFVLQLSLFVGFSNSSTQAGNVWILGEFDLDLRTQLECSGEILKTPVLEPVSTLENSLRSWAQVSDHNVSLKVVLSGVVDFDPTTEILTWFPSESSSEGIPMKRLLRYFQYSNDSFELIACLNCDSKSLNRVSKMMDGTITGAEDKHRILILADDVTSQMSVSTQQLWQSLLTSSFDETDVPLTERLQGLVTAEGCWFRDQGVGTNLVEWRGEKHLPKVVGSPLENVELNRFDILAMDVDTGFSPLYELNARKDGLEEIGTHYRMDRSLPEESFPTSNFAVRGYSVDLTHGHPLAFIAPSEFSHDGGSTRKSPEQWVFWLFPRNLSEAYDGMEIVRIEGDSVKIHCLSDEWKLQCRSGSMRQSIELVPDVWNLILWERYPVRDKGKFERFYPIDSVNIEPWEPVYGSARDPVEVRTYLEDSKLLLDSIRMYRGIDQEFIEGLNRERYHRFSISQLVYTDQQQLDKGIRRETKGAAQLADWNNLKACFTGDGEQFVKAYNLEYEEGFFVKRSGSRWFGQDRQYFMQRNDHTPREAFLVHDHFEDQLMVLGSWRRLYIRAFCEIDDLLALEED